jgi:diguanylate cyclase (GGDEF)-like protein/PAS domain S-box-containing protein
MSSAPLPDNEGERLAALRQYELLDTPVDPAYDAFTSLAATICDTPMASISLVDANRQWFKSTVGLDGATETPRDIAFCAHAILSGQLLEVPDTKLDARFAENPLVTQDPNYRFYAGVPLIDRDGYALGTLCTLDRRPRKLSEKQREQMQLLGASLVALIESRKDVPPANLEQTALLGRALEFSPVPMALLSAKPGDRVTIVYVNRAFTELFKYAPAELIGKDPKILRGAKTDLAAIGRVRGSRETLEGSIETVFLYTSAGVAKYVELRDRPIDVVHRIIGIRDLTQIQATQDALTDTNQRLQSLLANNTDAVLTMDRNGLCIDANSAATTIFGYRREDLLGYGFLKLGGDGMFPGDDILPDVLTNGQPMAFPADFQHRDGRRLTMQCTAIPITVRNVTDGAYLIARDVTEEKRLSNLVVHQADRTHALYLISAATNTSNAEQIDSALELVLQTFDMQWGYVGEVVGRELILRNVAGEPVRGVGSVTDIDQTLVKRTLERNDVFAIDDIAQPEWHLPGRGDLDAWHGYISAPLTVDGRPYGAVGFVSKKIVSFDDYDRDFVRLVAALISNALANQGQRLRLNRLAFYDSLTGLQNRAKFMRDLDVVISLGKRHQRSFALHYIDLDGFKNINDGAGHAVGDEALQEVARRLLLAGRLEDVPARIGGDEFVLIQADVVEPSESEALGNRIVEMLSEPYVLGDRTFDMSASVGIAVFPHDGKDATTLLKSADSALYRAKTSGKNRVELSAGQTA